ncbi:dihydrofolate reductase [Bacillus coahuilensis p1.1.43]|uniref:Dihydrofolate reductase n=1 Tax=Bacillus coahuilensis p1.1.43 TaxID=1150625 RepID=A0A147K8I8_9BACI|nr:dihydrofolate reductase [Bacillus coahuilensis]KUP06494.1 dihydrofolate reductase [Bacillus coahuilensis p1.1.43]
MITLIWAMDENGLIGKDNSMPWHLPKDLKHFKTKTTGRTIIMGRKTFESLGKPLPNRKNIVLTRNQHSHIEGCETVHSIEDIIRMNQQSSEEYMVIGGSQIYKEFLPFADKLEVTLIHDTFEGDTYFPTIDWDMFKLIEQVQGERDKHNPYSFEFRTYITK